MILPAEPSSDPDTDLACPSSPVRCTVRLYHRLRSSLYLSSWKEAFYSPFYTILASASISRRGMCLVVVFLYRLPPARLCQSGVRRGVHQIAQVIVWKPIAVLPPYTLSGFGGYRPC